MKVKQAIVADAGVSSRFLPVVKSIPKSFIPIGGKPIIQYLIEELVEAGIEKIIVVTRPDTESFFQDYFHNKREDLKEFLTKMNKPERYSSIEKIFSFPEIKVVIQTPDMPYGTATPILVAKEYLNYGEPFMVLQGDDVVFAKKKDCQLLIEEFEKNESYSAYITAEEVTEDRIHLYGSIKFKEGTTDELDYIVEKASSEDAPSLLASYGRFLYTWKIFDYMHPQRFGKDNEVWNVDALTAMAKEYPVKVIPNNGSWFTTGDPKNYLKTLIYWGLKESEFKEEINQFMRELIEGNNS
jgi:UTP--glucose-1-phosphate uridylyltransferase